MTMITTMITAIATALIARFLLGFLTSSNCIIQGTFAEFVRYKLFFGTPNNPITYPRTLKLLWKQAKEDSLSAKRHFLMCSIEGTL
jgi:hypothetical protein